MRGELLDRNGPFLAAELLSLGLEPARITIVGDRADELEGALRGALDADLCVVSGGLGPTHDDRTVEILARVAERRLLVDEALEREIEAVSRAFAARFGRRYADFALGVRKQASLPEGALSLGLAGTAPGVVLETGGCVAVALPGPPAELRRLWRRALEAEPVLRLLGRARPPARRRLRLFGVPESEVAQALAAGGGEGEGVDVTICARDFEIHVDIVAEPHAEARAEVLASALREPLAPYLFAEDDRPVEELVLELCRARQLRLAVAESCTGGLVASRLTAVPGSSDVFVGGVVAYANEIKEAQLDVPATVLREHGAVSSQAAEAMAQGARRRLAANVAVAVTGIAGPDGGTPEKPVGLVYLHAEGPGGGRGAELSVPGDREAVRSRAATTALHLVRNLLSQS